MGLLTTAVVTAAVAEVLPERAGIASGVNNTARQTGCALGVADGRRTDPNGDFRDGPAHGGRDRGGLVADGNPRDTGRRANPGGCVLVRQFCQQRLDIPPFAARVLRQQCQRRGQLFPGLGELSEFA